MVHGRVARRPRPKTATLESPPSIAQARRPDNLLVRYAGTPVAPTLSGMALVMHVGLRWPDEPSGVIDFVWHVESQADTVSRSALSRSRSSIPSSGRHSGMNISLVYSSA